ncbi:MAG TPA: bifunctional phosphoribosyl-AMP cyclohydrolase/phosphoribosyl-ATP diphosphatase HisIE [Polyangiaceae bacterium]|nr:bifunctional phosphoribosyl-AMP cyclohydrolase/phosphoribosyl-ATP diphosphatase HisIE [Polyangiaceae bacterium]HMR75140.1 bifunctional phosphoribosyl-AMP cyclohydrolase/phosphoribosyl-ATP diphosphatase HisIE [Polyangiaceae bacterium]
MDVRFNDQGLVAAIAQDSLSGEVRMVAWMNQLALDQTLSSGLATFYSRSRGQLWTKGETSGNRLVVREVWTDCDADALLLLVEPEGPSCHTGRPSCFFRRLSPNSADDSRARLTLQALEATIYARKSSAANVSYTRSLLDAGPSKIGAKLREEADELARAIDDETDQRVAAEAADLLFHMLVGLASRDVPLRRVLEALQSRVGVSGHEEKNRRGAG